MQYVIIKKSRKYACKTEIDIWSVCMVALVNNSVSAGERMKQNPRSNVYECFLRLLWLISVFTMITVAFYVSNGKAVYAAEVKMPAFSGYPYTEVNGNRPFFGTRDYTLKAFETYDELDNLGRCGKAFANVSSETMPTEERGNIGLIKPSGWNQVKYDGIIDTDPPYLYNRVHLIGWQLSGENANERNLITGTRYLNIEGMLPFESRIADHVKKTKGHVLYRVTPMFKGDNNKNLANMLK